MATKKGTKSNGGNSFGGWVFVNVTLSSDDKKRLADCVAANRYPLALVGDLVSAGYKVSFSLDSKNNSYICSISDTREDSPFYKHILSGRGANALNSWYAVCYKHIAMADGDWSVVAEVGTNGGADFG